MDVNTDAQDVLLQRRCIMEDVSFMSGKAVGGRERWQARCRLRHPEVNMATVDYCRFTATGIDHLLRGRWLPLYSQI